MKKRKIVLSVFFVAAVSLSVSAFFAVRCTYVPAEASAASAHLLVLLRQEKFQDAYAFIEHNSNTGTSFENFMRKVSRDCPRCGSGFSFVFRYASPNQTYGNRLRRFLSGRRIDMERINLDYLLCGEIPFRVTLSSDRGGKWKIVNFQVHAE
jgi:hypothetical protein